MVAAKQPPRHPPKKAGDTQGLHSSPGRERGPGRTDVSMAKATGIPGTKTMILRESGSSSPKLVGRGRGQQGLAPQYQQRPLGPTQDLHTALNLE